MDSGASKNHSQGIYAGRVWKRPLLWLNLVCLDAPLVAVAWQWLFARSFHVTLSLADRAALFLTAWVIYLADRWADSYSLGPGSARSLRQEFCSRHQAIWLGSIMVIGVSDVGIILRELDHETLVLGVIFGIGTVAYLAVNHAASRWWSAVPLKEVAIGFLFAGGTLVAIASRFSFATLAFPAFLFACLCSLNCVSIAAWERELDLAQARHSIATRWRRVDTFILILLAALAISDAVFIFVDHSLKQIGECVGASAIFLGALHFVPIARDERAALADLVLLTPLGFFIFERFW